MEIEKLKRAESSQQNSKSNKPEQGLLLLELVLSNRTIAVRLEIKVLYWGTKKDGKEYRKNII